MPSKLWRLPAGLRLFLRRIPAHRPELRMTSFDQIAHYAETELRRVATEQISGQRSPTYREYGRGQSCPGVARHPDREAAVHVPTEFRSRWSVRWPETPAPLLRRCGPCARGRYDALQVSPQVLWQHCRARWNRFFYRGVDPDWRRNCGLSC